MKEERSYKAFVYHLSELDVDERLRKEDIEFFQQNYRNILYHMKDYDWDPSFHERLIQLIPDEMVS